MASLQMEELPAKYPDAQMFGALPAYGIVGRHVDGIVLQNVTITCAKEDGRPALVLDDVVGLNMRALVTGPRTDMEGIPGGHLVQFRVTPEVSKITALPLPGGLYNLSN